MYQNNNTQTQYQQNNTYPANTYAQPQAAWQGQPQAQAAQATPTFSDLFNSMGGTRGAFNKDTPAGTTVTGILASDPDTRQATDFQTKQPAYFRKSGKPKYEIVFDLRTDLREDQDDDGMRSVWVHWWGVQRDALMQAFREFGRQPHKGDRMSVTFDGFVPVEGAPQPAKHYVYRFEPGMPVAPSAAQADATPAMRQPATTPAMAPVASQPVAQQAGGVLSAQQVGQIRQLKALGKTPDEVAALTGIDVQTVRQAVAQPVGQGAEDAEPAF